MCGGLSEGMGMKTYSHGPMDFVKKRTLRFPGRGPGLARKDKEVYQ